MSKPTVLIVPGAWLLPTGWQPFTRTLSQAGYPTSYVTLPTVGGRKPPLASLTDDVLAATNALGELVDDGKDVVVLCHSSGGVVGSNAVRGFEKAARREDGLEGGVVLVVFLSAFMLPSGTSLLDALGGQPLPWMHLQGDRVTGVAALLPQVAFNDLAPNDAAKWISQMTHTSAALFAMPSGHEPWRGSVPCAYIFSEDDNALPLPVQQQMAGQLGPEPNTASVKSGHCPFLSVPDALLGALEEVISNIGET